MKIEISEFSDGFAITVDNERITFNQEDSIYALTEVFKRVKPDAEIEYVEEY